MKHRDFLGSAGVASGSRRSARFRADWPGRRRAPAQHPVHPGRRTAVPLGLPNRREKCRRVPAALHAKRAFAVARGVKFGRHYTAASACTPSRGVLITGLYSQQSWLMLTLTNNPGQRALTPPLNPAYPTFGKLLRKAGYRTPYIGKWHVSFDLRRGWSRMDSKGSSPRTRSASICRAPSDRSPTSERPGHFEPGRPMDEPPLAERTALVRHGQFREPARSGVLLGRHRIPDLQQSVPGGRLAAGQGILDPGRSADGLLG